MFTAEHEARKRLPDGQETGSSPADLKGHTQEGGSHPEVALPPGTATVQQPEPSGLD